jgi:hypothetical protein
MVDAANGVPTALVDRVLLPAFRIVTTLAGPVRPMFPVIYTLIKSFNELDWSGDPSESRRLAGRELLTVHDAARLSL